MFMILLAAPSVVTSVHAAEDSGTWRGKWWNYYERGLQHAEQEEWESAAGDLMKAAELRDRDQRRARTYGMHFVDYFPHRELGVLYFRKGDFERAIAELERSIRSEATAKAVFYLNKARQFILIRTSGSKLPPPTITIATPAAGHLTGSGTIRVAGRASGEGYVSRILLNGTPLRVEMSAQEISFEREVSLEEGSNTIVIVAEDLVGKRAETVLPIVLKREGPVIAVSQARLVKEGGRHVVAVAGEVRDAAGIAQVTVGGVGEQAAGSKLVKIEKMVAVDGTLSVIAVEATDLVGNRTLAQVAVQPQVIDQEALSRAAREEDERARRAGEEQLAREQAEMDRIAAAQAEKERIEREQAEADRVARVQAEQERQTREEAEQQYLKAKMQAARAAEARAMALLEAEQLRLATEQAESAANLTRKAAEEQAALEQAERERLAWEQAERERLANERVCWERIAREKAEAERIAREKAEQERLARERAEQERIAREKAEAERIAREKAEAERLARERAEQERIAREQAEAERVTREKAELERIAREKAEAERRAREKAEAERIAREKAEAERIAQEKAEQERLARERAEQERLARERLVWQKQEQERIARETEEKERRERERVAFEQSMQERKAELERKAREMKKRRQRDQAAPGAPKPSRPAGPDREPPAIVLKEADEQQAVFGIDTYAVQGYAADDNQVKRVRIGGTDLALPTGPKIYFSKTVKLREGENRIPVEAIDQAGNRSVKEIVVVRTVPSVMSPSSRTSMLVLPPDSGGREAGNVSPVLDDYLSGEFIRQKRFKMVERKKVKQVLDEQKFTAAMSDPEQAIRIGNLAAADMVVAGTVREDAKSVELFLRVINSETAEQMAQADAYIEDKGRESIQHLVESIVSKVAENFPVVEGVVIERDSGEVMANVGSQSRVKQNMGVIFFRKGSEIKDPVTGKVIGVKTVQLGEGRISDVQQGFSKVLLSDKAVKADINAKDMFVTK